MQAAFAEMPLALFTSLASIGAGGFIALAIALFSVRFRDGQLAKLDKLSFVPLAFVIVGFIAAFFHLTNALNAVNVFNGLGASPMTNEIVAGSVFTVVALVYCVLAFTGKLSDGSRKGFAAVVALLAVVFAVFMGLAYMMPTIPSWDTVASPVQMIGFTFVGGAALGVALLGAACGRSDGSFTMACIALSIVGVVLGAGGLLLQVSSVSGMENAVVAGADLVAAAMPAVICGIACLIVSCVLTVLAVRGRSWVALGSVAVVIAFAGILASRLAFYAMEMSVGLTL